MNLLSSQDSIDLGHFETSRLILRLPVLEDAGAIQRLANKRIVAEMTSRIRHPYPRHGATDCINEAHCDWHERRILSLAICLRSSGEVAGAISMQVDGVNAKLGYWVGVPYWGNWYASEALHRGVRFGFNQLELQRMNSSYFRHQPDCGLALHKAGLPFEGVEALGGCRFGKRHDRVDHRITSERWRANIRISSLS